MVHGLSYFLNFHFSFYFLIYLKHICYINYYPLVFDKKKFLAERSLHCVADSQVFCSNPKLPSGFGFLFYFFLRFFFFFNSKHKYPPRFKSQNLNPTVHWTQSQVYAKTKTLPPIGLRSTFTTAHRFTVHSSSSLPLHHGGLLRCSTAP